MRHGLIGIFILTLAACGGGSEGSDSPGPDTEIAGDVVAGPIDVPAAEDTSPPEDTSLPSDDLPALDLAEPEPHPIGMEVPPFSLEDLNPSSATHGQAIAAADLAGEPYALIFLDSRCPECGAVADALWAVYEAHPTWWAAQPTFAIQRAAASEKAPQTVDGVVDGNSLPYLLDTVETNLWMAFLALNHDFFAIGPDGTLEVWLALYTLPEAIDMFETHMTGRYGP